MNKLIQLKLSKVKYSGDSIGDDIRVEIEILGKFFLIDKIIKVGETAEINKEIGNFETDRALFASGLKITVTERDLLFNDTGSTDGNIKINTSLTKPQQFIYKIKIRETRSIFGKFWGKKIANFEITLEASILDAVRYILDEDDGWLITKIEGVKLPISLSAYLKVKPKGVYNGREYFIILEGAYRGKSASVKLKESGLSHLIFGVKHEPMVRASYSISKKIFALNGKKYATVDYKNAPWQKGLYDIEIPDYPHLGGARYEKQAPRAKTWFRIGHGGERYLHTGGRSLGCITIIETARWVEIYNALIKARKSDFTSVGILEVVD